nr:helix-turn-helix transcriptional regulator [uncultured Cohaesibacter sp.]
MISLVAASKARSKLRDNVRARRLGMNLTQAGLADRSGVPLPTLRKFEQTGSISLEAFLKLLMVVGGIEEVIEATENPPEEFTSIDDVLKPEPGLKRQRGRLK